MAMLSIMGEVKEEESMVRMYGGTEWKWAPLHCLHSYVLACLYMKLSGMIIRIAEGSKL